MYACNNPFLPTPTGHSSGAILNVIVRRSKQQQFVGRVAVVAVFAMVLLCVHKDKKRQVNMESSIRKLEVLRRFTLRLSNLTLDSPA